MNSLEARVREIAVPRNRLHHPEGIRRVEAWIHDALASRGWTVERRAFRVDAALARHVTNVHPQALHGLEGVNLVATRRPGPGLVIGAHYDTVEGTPGADDNAASVVALVELAEQLRDSPNPVTLVAFDMEEFGLLGARIAQPQLPATGVVVLESLAYTDTRPGTQRLPTGLETVFPDQVRELWRRRLAGNSTVLLHRANSRDLAERLAARLETEHPLAFELPGDTLLAREFSRSDHLPFWQAGVPAVLVTDSADYRNPHYHKPTDTPETLDYERLAAVIRAVAEEAR